MSSKIIKEAGLELDWGEDDVTKGVIDSLKKHASIVGVTTVQAFRRGNVKDVLNTLRAIYDKAMKDVGVKESASLADLKNHLRILIKEEGEAPTPSSTTSDGDAEKLARKEKEEKSFRERNEDRDIGEILYHLDMSTRHMDVLQDYEHVASHSDELAKIASIIQDLAQRIRKELQR